MLHRRQRGALPRREPTLTEEGSTLCSNLGQVEGTVNNHVFLIEVAGLDAKTHAGGKGISRSPRV